MIEVIDCDQGTDAWLQARLGLPTASVFADVLAKGQGKTRATLMRKLAAERITGRPVESYKNTDMARGNAMEEQLRRLYAFQNDAELTRVGFVRNGNKGCSPDSLIGADGILEIKSQRPDLLIETLTSGRFPPEHVAQCQGALWVCERDYIDIAIGWWDGEARGQLPLFVKRAYRDVAYIVTLASEVARFCDELDELVERIKRL